MITRPSRLFPTDYHFKNPAADLDDKIRAAWRESHFLAPQLARRFGVTLDRVIVAIEGGKSKRY